MAEGEPIQWLNGRAHVPGSVEKICPKRHIGQGQWQSEWNLEYLKNGSTWCYNYISDYECIFHPVNADINKSVYKELWDNLQVAKQQGTNVPITKLAHFTTPDAAKKIIKSGGFKGRLKKINEDAQGYAIAARFSWWSPKFSETDKKQVRDNIGAAIKPFVHLYDDDDDDDNDEDDDGDDSDDKFDDNKVGDDDDDDDDGDDGDDKVYDNKVGDDDDDDDDDGDDSDDKIDDNKVGDDDDDDDDDGDDSDDKVDDDDDDDDGDDKMDEDNDDQVDDHQLLPLKSQFATSNAFIANSWRYGSSYFLYDIDDLCHYYGNHFKGELQFKILGTFGYKKEVMHAVLVCSQANGAGMFKAYPDVLTPAEDINNDAVVTRDNDGNWVWRPQATGSEIRRLLGYPTRPKFRRWEHVAFAFHIPDGFEKKSGRALITVNDIKKHKHEM